MNIMDVLKRKERESTDKSRIDQRGRKQLNVMVEPRLILKLKKLNMGLVLAYQFCLYVIHLALRFY